MSVVVDAAAAAASRRPRSSQRPARPDLRSTSLAGFVLLSLVRVITGADELTSSGTLRVALTAAMPIALAGLGGLWSERAGVVNIGLEGMMILGTLGAGYFGYHYGVVGRRASARCSSALLGGALHALATVVFGVDHIVSGVAINIIAAGVAGVPRRGLVHRPARAAARRSRRRCTTPPDDRHPVHRRPGRTTLEDKHWFLICDLAGSSEMLTKNLSVAHHPRRWC